MNRKGVLTASPKKALSENVRERPVTDLGMRLSRRKTMQNRENGPGGHRAQNNSSDTRRCTAGQKEAGEIAGPTPTGW